MIAHVRVAWVEQGAVCYWGDWIGAWLQAPRASASLSLLRPGVPFDEVMPLAGLAVVALAIGMGAVVTAAVRRRG